MTRRESLIAMLGAVLGVSQEDAGIPGTRAVCTHQRWDLASQSCSTCGTTKVQLFLRSIGLRLLEDAKRLHERMEVTHD